MCAGTPRTPSGECREVRGWGRETDKDSRLNAGGFIEVDIYLGIRARFASHSRIFWRGANLARNSRYFRVSRSPHAPKREFRSPRSPIRGGAAPSSEAREAERVNKRADEQAGVRTGNKRADEPTAPTHERESGPGPPSPPPPARTQPAPSPHPARTQPAVDPPAADPPAAIGYLHEHRRTASFPRSLCAA
jgi:hypothetical protein